MSTHCPLISPLSHIYAADDTQAGVLSSPLNESPRIGVRL